MSEYLFVCKVTFSDGLKNVELLKSGIIYSVVVKMEKSDAKSSPKAEEKVRKINIENERNFVDAVEKQFAKQFCLSGTSNSLSLPPIETWFTAEKW